MTLEFGKRRMGEMWFICSLAMAQLLRAPRGIGTKSWKAHLKRKARNLPKPRRQSGTSWTNSGVRMRRPPHDIYTLYATAAAKTIFVTLRSANPLEPAVICKEREVFAEVFEAPHALALSICRSSTLGPQPITTFSQHRAVLSCSTAASCCFHMRSLARGNFAN